MLGMHSSTDATLTARDLAIHPPQPSKLLDSLHTVWLLRLFLTAPFTCMTLVIPGSMETRRRQLSDGESCHSQTGGRESDLIHLPLIRTSFLHYSPSINTGKEVINTLW